MKSRGAELITAEREGHEERGFTLAHDLIHRNGELVNAARTYLMVAERIRKGEPLSKVNTAFCWPFAPEDFHPARDQLHNLVKAGALIAAQIDRLLAEEEIAARRERMAQRRSPYRTP